MKRCESSYFRKILIGTHLEISSEKEINSSRVTTCTIRSITDITVI